jgi:hypothetical protein
MQGSNSSIPFILRSEILSRTSFSHPELYVNVGYSASGGVLFIEDIALNT